MISIATDEAVQMISNGWGVRYNEDRDQIEWQSSAGAGPWYSESLDDPPLAAVAHARDIGDVEDRPRRCP